MELASTSWRKRRLSTSSISTWFYCLFKLQQQARSTKSNQQELSVNYALSVSLSLALNFLKTCFYCSPFICATTPPPTSLQTPPLPSVQQFIVNTAINKKRKQNNKNNCTIMALGRSIKMYLTIFVATTCMYMVLYQYHMSGQALPQPDIIKVSFTIFLPLFLFLSLSLYLIKTFFLYSSNTKTKK